MNTVFSKIIKGEIPCYKIAEDENNIAFLDINPLTRGHTIAIPKVQVDYIFDVNDDEYKKLFLFAKKVAKGIDKVIDCKRVGVAVLGLEVPHAHIHLVPINGIYDIDFSKPKMNLSEEEFVQISELISKNIEL